MKGFEIFIKKLNSLKIVKKWFKVVKIDNLIIGLLFLGNNKKILFCDINENLFNSSITVSFR